MIITFTKTVQNLVAALKEISQSLCLVPQAVRTEDAVQA